MVQPTPSLNSSITVLKKLPTTNNQLSSKLYKKPQQQQMLPLIQDTTSIKLPTIIKKTPASSKRYIINIKIKFDDFFFYIVTKPIPSAYIQDSSYELELILF